MRFKEVISTHGAIRINKGMAKTAATAIIVIVGAMRMLKNKIPPTKQQMRATRTAIRTLLKKRVSRMPATMPPMEEPAVSNIYA
ncbi:MAG TPA: hypothetical protein VHD85_16730 [Terracidiphilus sp.]|nr:hypothetical protein [Terracidiphilus sp.]